MNEQFFNPEDFPECISDGASITAVAQPNGVNSTNIPIGAFDDGNFAVDTLLTEEWLEDRLLAGCNCTVLSLLNADHGSVFCIEFPVKHLPVVQLLYVCLFSLLIFLSSAGNIAVVW